MRPRVLRNVHHMLFEESILCTSSIVVDMSVQQHIKKGIPRHQDFVLNSYFDDSCKAVNVSILLQFATAVQGYV